MSIPIRCGTCGFEAVAVDGLAGKSVQCRQCRGIIRVPTPEPGWSGAEEPSGPAFATDRPDPGEVRDEEDAEERYHVLWLAGAISSFCLLSLLALFAILGQKAVPRSIVAADQSHSSAPDAPVREAPVPEAPAPSVAAQPAPETRPEPTPEPTPAPEPAAMGARVAEFPRIGLGSEIEPGVLFQEIRLAPANGTGPGGRLWLYLPAGWHADHSLPCVLIAGAGSTLLKGMALAEGDRAEHLPYVRAGFAVLAFDLDGDVRRENPSDSELRRGYLAFRAARAGLANAHDALEYVLARVPQVDPSRLFAAGHSSAATLAMLFAEHEPRLAGCVAYAPRIDVEEKLAPHARVLETIFPGLREFLAESSPKNHESTLSCPILLFFAEDDANTPAQKGRESAERLRRLGKSVTITTVPSGGHYQSMIDLGIPTGISWMTRRMADRGLPGPSTPPRPLVISGSSPRPVRRQAPTPPAPPPESPTPGDSLATDPGFVPPLGQGGFEPPANPRVRRSRPRPIGP